MIFAGVLAYWGELPVGAHESPRAGLSRRTADHASRSSTFPYLGLRTAMPGGVA